MAGDPQLPRPRLPQRNGKRAPPRNATFIAFAALLAGAIAFAGLVAAAMTGFAPFAFVVTLPIIAIVALLFGGHYLLWGVWLDRMHASRGQERPVEFWKRAAPQQIIPDESADDEPT